MRKAALFSFAIILCQAPTLTFAQEGYFANWFPRVDKTQAEQPHWVTPVATTTPRLEEEFRFDQFWQRNAEGFATENYDGGKGLELIPLEKVEVIFNLPPYIEHHNSKTKDGFGDEAFLIKYRFLASNEETGNYILTGFLSWSLPTGTYNNGALHPIITPTIAYGKGLKGFDVQGTFGVAFPTSDTHLIGNSYLWNNTFQYRIMRKIWPEVELNSTFFQGGPHDGMKQNFVTPGLLMGRFHLFHSRVGCTFGGGFQIATTHFHSNNHNGILSLRFPF